MNYGQAYGFDSRATTELLRDSKPARSVTGSRLYKTPAHELWDALTNPERLPQWFLPVSGELRVGGRYKLTGHAGGTITRCEAPVALDATWEHGDSVSWIRLRLAAEDGGTRFTLEHLMLKDEQGEAHWEIYGPGATGVGWELAFLALDYHLTSGGTIDPKAHEAWTMSEQGKDFVRNSASAWGEVHISAGEDEQVARGMAKKTTAFYTGE